MVDWNPAVKAFCDDQWTGIPSDYLSCSQVLTPTTTAGNPLTLGFLNNNDAFNVTPRTLTGAYSCHTSSAPLCTQNACTTGNAIDTFTLHHGGADPFIANTSATVSSGGTTSVDAATVTSGAGGANCVSAYWTDNGLLESKGLHFVEGNTTAGAAHVASISTAGLNSLNNTTNIVTPVVLGNSLIVETETSACNNGTVGSPWTGGLSLGHWCDSYLLNVSSASAPVWTWTGEAYSAAAVSVVWAEGAAVVGSTVTGSTDNGATRQ